ncbi:hypothetical protein BGY98DRAFT_1092567 [Russula aff. rugulosa BPL654]|nr:hypothetical protein BGY98DRAFT_1092567 [Russula aff. rugulosa BPL654]
MRAPNQVIALIDALIIGVTLTTARVDDGLTGIRAVNSRQAPNSPRSQCWIDPIGDRQIAKTLHTSSMESGSEVIIEWDTPPMNNATRIEYLHIAFLQFSGPIFWSDLDYS